MWSECEVTCGGGYISRTRGCKNATVELCLELSPRGEVAFEQLECGTRKCSRKLFSF